MASLLLAFGRRGTCGVDVVVTVEEEEGGRDVEEESSCHALRLPPPPKKGGVTCARRCLLEHPKLPDPQGVLRGHSESLKESAFCFPLSDEKNGRSSG